MQLSQRKLPDKDGTHLSQRKLDQGKEKVTTAKVETKNIASQLRTGGLDESIVVKWHDDGKVEGCNLSESGKTTKVGKKVSNCNFQSRQRINKYKKDGRGQRSRHAICWEGKGVTRISNQRNS
mmetsp:Transcript_24275/g.35972  ORF Transcript_24275/g.35972 Transcript_24275/m.35972 type:complete len:123 (+) Transcript_24275:1705-2073(+)